MTYPARATVVAVVALFAAAPAFADPPSARSITTSGDAVVYVTPDRATVTVAVQSFAGKLDDAKKASRDGGKALLAALKAAGVEDKQVGTDEATLTVAYNTNYQPSSGVAGFTARRQYHIKLDDPKKADAIVEAALKNGANELVGIEYADSKQREHRDEARRAAAKAAREKAADLAAQFETAVGPVRTVRENSMSWGGFNGNGNNSQNQSVDEPALERGDAADTLPAGRMAVRASVTAEFALQDLPPKEAAATTRPVVGAK